MSTEERNIYEGEIEELSPYEASYPAKLLLCRLKNEIDRAQSAAGTIYNVVVKEAPMLVQIRNATKKGVRYVVDATEETLDALDKGKIKLSFEKGKMVAQLREANGHYGEKLGIKKEVFRKGMDPAQVANSLQMKTLEAQIEEMAYQISAIDKNVHEVLLGQQNDRIGLYYSGLALYLEARVVSDETMKKQLMVQALKTLSEASFQLGLTMQSDIKYLANKEYDSDKKKRVQLIDEHISSINKSFEFIHQASMLRAAIYCEQGEMSAMSTVLSEYSHVLEKTVVENARLLGEADINDNGTEDGIWAQRAKFKLDVTDIKRQLTSEDKTFYIGFVEENANEED